MSVNHTKFYMWQNGLCITYTLRFKQIEQFFIANEWELTTDPAQADYVIIGACASFSPFFDLYEEKIRNLDSINCKIVVYGCLPIVDPEFFRRTTPEVELFIPPRFPEQIEKLIKEPKVCWSDIPTPGEFRIEDYSCFVPNKRYIHIQEGCSEGCVFCPHKLAIGKETSRPMEDIIAQVQRDVADGASIIYLEGNNAGSWGLDLTPKKTYADLMKNILKNSGDCEIHVGNFSPRWVREYGEALIHPRITDIKIPIQTTSPRLLKLMGRDPYAKEMDNLLKTLRRGNNRLVLRTEIIIGFPTETEEELLDTLEFVSEHFDKVACYSLDFYLNTKIASMEFPFFDVSVIEKRLQYAMAFFKDKPNIKANFCQGDILTKYLKGYKERSKRLQPNSNT